MKKLFQSNTAHGYAIQINGPVHLRDGTSIDQCCLRDPRITDPREDKDRVEANNGRLLRGCYAWVLESPDFATGGIVTTQLL